MNMLIVAREMAYSRADLTAEQKQELNLFFTENNRKILIAGIIIGFCLAAVGISVSLFLKVI